MQCPNCGRDNPEGAQFCSACGVPLSSPGPFRPQGAATELTMVNFPDAIKLGFKRYFDFRGRSTRAEFWWWALFELIAGIALSIAEAIAGTSGTLGGLFEFAALIPGLAVGVRRLHDTNRTGWWLLLVFAVIIGCIVLLVWFIKQGDAGPNKYGPDSRHAFAQLGSQAKGVNSSRRFWDLRKVVIPLVESAVPVGSGVLGLPWS